MSLKTRRQMLQWQTIMTFIYNLEVINYVRVLNLRHLFYLVRMLHGGSP